MTRQDYIKIAKVLREEEASEPLVYRFVTMLQNDNQRFNPERFRIACAHKRTARYT
jgi:hypothetical protein